MSFSGVFMWRMLVVGTTIRSERPFVGCSFNWLLGWLVDSMVLFQGATGRRKTHFQSSDHHTAVPTRETKTQFGWGCTFANVFYEYLLDQSSHYMCFTIYIHIYLIVLFFHYRSCDGWVDKSISPTFQTLLGRCPYFDAQFEDKS